MEWWQVVLIVLASVVAGLLVGGFLSYLILRFIKRPEVTSVVEPLKLTAADLLAEVKHNHKLATEPLTGRLLSFQTGVWDARQYEFDKFPANLRDELERVYNDIRLANNLVWVSTEFNRRTPNLDEKYRKLCASIAERLDRIKLIIEHNTFSTQLTKRDLAMERIIAIKPGGGLRTIEPIIYLLAIAAAQAVTTFYVPPWGILSHITILTLMIVRSASVDDYLHQRLLLPLALVPLLRIISLSMPLTDIPPILLYYVSYAPLLVVAGVAMGLLGYAPQQVGVSLRRFPIQLVVGLTGIVFGVAEYFILVPEPMIAELTLREVWLPALILLVCAGFMEEFVFRGVLQSSSTEAFGGWGIVYVSLLFAVTHIGFLPVIDLVFVFVVALFFGWVVRKTGSLLGVALSHGISSIALYLIIPLLF